MFDVITIPLEKLLKKEKKTLYRVAKDTGISYQALSAIKTGTVTNIRASTAEKLCKSLNCRIEDLIVFK